MTPAEQFHLQMKRSYRCWSLGQFALIGSIIVLFLARLFPRGDFGIIAIVGLVVAVFDALTDLRFGQALVHDQGAAIEEYNTAWTFNLILDIQP